MNLIELTFEDICDKIKKQEGFSFSRWGDGEWNCVFKKQGCNCDGHRYYESLAERLRDVLYREPKYYMGIQPLAMKLDGDNINRFLERNNINVSWCNSDIIHDASIAHKLYMLYEAVENKSYVKVSSFDGPFSILIPKRNCWLAYEYIKSAVIEWIFWHIEDNPIIMLSCGMMAEVLIDDLWEMFGTDITVLDMGSVFDPYCGLSTRKYHKQIIEHIKQQKGDETI